MHQNSKHYSTNFLRPHVSEEAREQAHEVRVAKDALTGRLLLGALPVASRANMGRRQEAAASEDVQKWPGQKVVPKGQEECQVLALGVPGQELEGRVVQGKGRKRGRVLIVGS
jgi:hypothetical protein